MAELRKTGESQYDVLVEEQIIGQIWNWHGSWSAQAGARLTTVTRVGSKQ